VTDDVSDERRASRSRSRERIQATIAKVSGVISDNLALAERHPARRARAMQRVYEGHDEIIMMEQQLAALQAEDESDRQT
jgi:hypothetical protein